MHNPQKTMCSMVGRRLRLRRSGMAALVAAALCAASAQAAQNCISNGDFATDRNGNVSAYITWGYERHGNQYTPHDWTLTDPNHMGHVNEGTARHNV